MTHISLFNLFQSRLYRDYIDIVTLLKSYLKLHALKYFAQSTNFKQNDTVISEGQGVLI